MGKPTFYDTVSLKLSNIVKATGKRSKTMNKINDKLSNSNLLWLILTTVIVLFITFFSISDKPSSALINSNINLQRIAVVLIAYHGTSCVGTIESALSNAKYPQRIEFFIGNAGSPTSSVPFHEPQSCLNGYDDIQNEMGSEIIMENVDLISETFSPFYGNNAVKSELINTQILEKHKSFDYIFEIHAHSLFSNHWDTEIISEWQSTNDDKAILTTYPSRTTEISSRLFDHHHGNTMNIICAAHFDTNKGDKNIKITYENPWEIKPPRYDAKNRNFIPIEIPFWSSFFSFGKFEYAVQVQYDPNLKTMTEEDGVELLYGARLRTHGFKMYAPVKDVTFHNYEAHQFERKYKIKRNIVELSKDQKRLNLLLSDENGTGSTDEYGFGDKMSLQKYYEIAGIDLKGHRSESLCDKIRSQKWQSL